MGMGGPEGSVSPDKWAADLDVSKVENTANLGFFGRGRCGGDRLVFAHVVPGRWTADPANA
jgi:hypothetical protein